MIIHRSKRKKKIISIRSKFGRPESHELLLFRSNEYIYGFVSSLSDMKTVFSVSTVNLKKDGVQTKGCGKVAISRLVGERIGKKCKELGIKPAVNVAQYKYHGRIKALVDGFMEMVK
ncbi:MAG: hypothetical protein JJW01_02025 [Alphaproteobacteria bacterium]|nr:hypothetical protein [Rickettsiales bacterium]